MISIKIKHPEVEDEREVEAAILIAYGIIPLFHEDNLLGMGIQEIVTALPGISSSDVLAAKLSTLNFGLKDLVSNIDSSAYDGHGGEIKDAAAHLLQLINKKMITSPSIQ